MIFIRLPIKYPLLIIKSAKIPLTWGWGSIDKTATNQNLAINKTNYIMSKSEPWCSRCLQRVLIIKIKYDMCLVRSYGKF